MDWKPVMNSFLQELKRRHVYKVATVYVVVGWGMLQLADVLFPAFGRQDGDLRLLAVSLFFGFPIALVLSWAYDLTPEGIKKTQPAGANEQVVVSLADHLIGALLVLIIGFTAYQEFGGGSSLQTDEIVSNNSEVVSQQAGTVAEIQLAEPVAGFSGRAAIAVLPFINLSNDPEQEYFADGLTEDLITGLQSFQSFPIISRTSSFKYKGTSPDIREVAADLGAGYVIEGSVRKVADDVRITIQLINHLGQHVWAENYNIKFANVLQIQSDLVARILIEIEPELIITESDRTRFVRTEDMEAYDYVLRAATNTLVPFSFTNFSGEEITPARLELAREYATKALEIDPNFAAAWRILNHVDGAYILNFSHTLSEQEFQLTLQRSIEYGQRSRRLSPFEPTVCSCLAAMLLINGDVEDALLLQEESLRQNPSNAVVHAMLAKILQVTGDYERALKEIDVALRLSPLGVDRTFFFYFRAAINQELGRFDEAIADAKRSLIVQPLNHDAEYIKIVSLYASGQREQAYQAMIQFRDSRPADFQPVSGWDQVFFESVANSIELGDGKSLHGLRYNEALQLIFEDLGWNPE